MTFINTSYLGGAATPEGTLKHSPKGIKYCITNGQNIASQMVKIFSAIAKTAAKCSNVNIFHKTKYFNKLTMSLPWLMVRILPNDYNFYLANDFLQNIKFAVEL